MSTAADDLQTRDDPQAAHGRVIEPGTVDLAHGAILYLEDITVSFDGFKALNNLNLMIETGELRCIIGPNGAGKTTMMDVITGKTNPDTGTAFFGQNIDLTRLSEAEIAHAGIGRKFQKPTVFEHHSAFENLELAMKTDKRVRHSLTVALDSAQRDKIAATLELIQLTTAADRPAGLLSHGQKQWLEIHRRASIAGLRIMRFDQRTKLSPRHQRFHPRQKRRLARGSAVLVEPRYRCQRHYVSSFNSPVCVSFYDNAMGNLFSVSLG